MECMENEISLHLNQSMYPANIKSNVMNSRKVIITVIGILFFHLNVFAQKMEDYSKNWKTVEGLEKKGLTASALKEAGIIFNMAITAGNEPQQVKAAMYQMKYRNLTEDENQQKNIFYLDTLIAKTKSPAKNILQSMQAELFWHYLQNNRYVFYDRTALLEENSKDISTWSIEKLQRTISDLYKASLKNNATLKNTPMATFDPILEKGKDTRFLRPTLYDFLGHRALAYFMDDESHITLPAYRFILNDEIIFAPVNQFTDATFKTKDSSALYYHALMLFQDLLRFHSPDKNPDALIDADLKRLEFAYQHGIFTNKEKLYESALQTIGNTYSNSAAAAQAGYLRAQLFYNRGQQYNSFTNQAPQFDIKTAADLCDSVIKKFPKSEGAIHAQQLLAGILQPSLKLETEKVNIPNQPFRTLVTYKNTPTLFFRIIQTTHEQAQSMIRNNNDEMWQKVSNLTAMKSWSIALPDLKDFQLHSTEIKIEPLPKGMYMILSSLDPSFSTGKNIMALQTIYVSNISYIRNNKDELFVLNRDNGQPLSKAIVQLWQQNYNYTTRTYDRIKRGRYITDANGFIKLVSDKEYYNYTIQVNYNDDELFLDDNYYNYQYNSYESPSAKRTFLFTDRSIYRPGQTVHFKGIVVNTDSASKKSSVLNGYKTTVMLFDVNDQKAGSIRLKSNEYGSYNGSFILPEGSLNGQFYIKDSANESVQYFNVEEYKRPKFFTEIKKPEGTYRLNDSIKVTGFAKAYAGNNIDGAKVTYRVKRIVRYPAWWEWGGYYRGKMTWPQSNEAMEITNGETVTDASGTFNVTFKAIPDESIDRKNQPTFYYEVMADITDINGETRSGSTSVAVAYQALQLDINLPAKITADSIKNIRINSTNFNDLYEKATVTLLIQKLQSPNRIFRARLWDLPDQFVMGRESFYKDFPYDAYADENILQKWPMGDKVCEQTDTTSKDAHWTLVPVKMDAGWYKITVTTTDRYGEAVKAEKFVQVTDPRNATTTEPIVVEVNNHQALPGENIRYSIRTGYEKIWLIQQVVKVNKSISTSFPVLTAASAYINDIPVLENDRGGIHMSYAFVQHNRVYDGSESFIIPWKNKELNISYETFRDKILPGSEEKWKIQIKGEKAEKIGAEALISMYDASLDQFKPHNWSSLQSLWPVLTDMVTWTKNGFAAVPSIALYRPLYDMVQEKEKSYDALLNNGWSDLYNRNYMYRGRLEGKASGVIVLAEAAAKDEGDLSKVPVEKMREKEIADKRLAPMTDSAVSAWATGERSNAPVNNPIQVRKNFNETAFFFPVLTTDTAGNISFQFTIPEALTQWKMMTMAHTKELASSYSEKTVVTQKPLMVQPNAPRFLREGDQVEFSSKIVNLSDREITGTAQLELFDAASNKPVDGWFKNVFPVQYFTVAAGQSVATRFPAEIPFTFNSALGYRIKAISTDGSFSDGEEAALPVLSNRMLVTESMPLNMRNTDRKIFKFEKLLNSGTSGSLTNHALTVEYTSNPAWYAVQALPYLMEYPYECAEQNFNRYYANVLAAHISNSHPAIKAVFDKWKITDTAALLSNLQKNEALKSVLLQETPWVLEAKDENQQKKNIALLFDLVRLAKEKTSTLNKLIEMQSSNGGFTWFKGGPDDRYITQYIITGIGHLRKLNALGKDDYIMLKPIVDKALPYLDARLKEEYDNLKKYKTSLKNNNLSYSAIQYLYMRSFFPETAIGKKTQTAYTYYRDQSKKFWLKNSRYMQAMIALSLHRLGDTKTPAAVIRSLKENAIYKEETGMYWKEFSTGGYYWHQAPIESQAMMIEAFSDIDKNQSTINDLKTWLLKQKQTQQWKTTKATAEACYALLLNGSDWLSEENEVSIQLGNTVISNKDKTTEAGTGYFKQVIPGEKVQQGMGNIAVRISTPTGQSNTGATSWGAVYWQYFEDLDKITAAETPLKLVKQLFVEKNSDRGPVLKALKEGDDLQIGDKVKVRIELRVDRDMEYVHMKDMRAACMEPVNVISEYKWQGGLGYYETTKDASTSFFFGWLQKGTYVFEYPLFVTHSGNFSNGVTTIQCMYAPEFTSHSNGIKVNVAGK